MNQRFKRVHIIVLDSLGAGEAPDAADFGDVGADTLGHIADRYEAIHLPVLRGLGLANIRVIKNLPPAENPSAYYTKMREKSNGKDTMTGHWEMMGLYIDKPFRVFPKGFPAELIRRIEEKTGRKTIGNVVASGTEIIKELGAEHMESGALIVYTSADSVLQIAAHEEVVPLDELYECCETCRKLTLDEPYKLGRVIARPFVGEPGGFTRTHNRRDYALKPFAPTTMNHLKDAGFSVFAIGKISDIYDGEGVTKSFHSTSNSDGMEQFTRLLDTPFTGLNFLNLVDFDAKYGHRRDAIGYGRALEEFDAQLAPALNKLTQEDLLIITADHGNDPTFAGTDHTREVVPLIVYSPRFKRGGELPPRKTFADIGATLAENFSVTRPDIGESFLHEIAD